jgi:hypothetical protein
LAENPTYRGAKARHGRGYLHDVRRSLRRVRRRSGADNKNRSANEEDGAYDWNNPSGRIGVANWILAWPAPQRAS